MSEETKAPTQTENRSSSAPPEVEPPPISLEELDGLLNAEDPNFNTEFATLRSEQIDVDIEVENFGDVQEAIEHPIAAPSRRPEKSVSLTFKNFIPFVFGSVTSGLRGFFHALSNFSGMSFKKKASVIVILASLALLVFVGVRVYKGRILPSFELQFLSSFKNIADKTYPIEKDEPFEDFDNPLRHPDFVVLIERLVVNLKSSSASANPMGMFEFYIEASTQEGAIEINERQKEIRDSMARTLENETYEELSSSDGKDRAKLALRRELNTLLQNGRVRRVFFKTIILKP